LPHRHTEILVSASRVGALLTGEERDILIVERRIVKTIQQQSSVDLDGRTGRCCNGGRNGAGLGAEAAAGFGASAAVAGPAGEGRPRRARSAPLNKPFSLRIDAIA